MRFQLLLCALAVQCQLLNCSQRLPASIGIDLSSQEEKAEIQRCKLVHFSETTPRVYLTGAAFSPESLPGVQSYHHIRLLYCEVGPDLSTGIDEWNCGPGNGEYIPPCGRGAIDSIAIDGMDGITGIYGGSEDFGYPVGGAQQRGALVLNVHRKRDIRSRNPDNENDFIEVELRWKLSRPHYLVGSLDIASPTGQVIKPLKTNPALGESVTSCFIPEGEAPFEPFFIHHHTHEHGQSMSLKIVRESTETAGLEQILLSNASRTGLDISTPSLTTDVFSPTEIRAGDLIVVKCTYRLPTNNSTLRIGGMTTDEMCDALVFYKTSHERLQIRICKSKSEIHL